MESLTAPAPIIRSHADGEERWFFGGGVHTWLARQEDTGGAYFLFEDVMERGKVTPLHTHPTDESMYVVDGEILMHMDGHEESVSAGGLVLAPRGVRHAFLVLSETAKVLSFHTSPGAQNFYLGASEPITAEHPASGIVDFDKIKASGVANGGIEILGPPPFSPPAS